jgi:hypothetical protein
LNGYRLSVEISPAQFPLFMLVLLSTIQDLVSVVFEMSVVNKRVIVVMLVSLIISSAAILISFSAYSVAGSIRFAPTMNYSTKSLGQTFNWAVAEVVEIQGNLYAYLGYEVTLSSGRTLRLAKWQNGWMELTYHFLSYEYSPFPANVTLSPYKLQVNDLNNDYLTALFFET